MGEKYNKDYINKVIASIKKPEDIQKANDFVSNLETYFKLLPIRTDDPEIIKQRRLAREVISNLYWDICVAVSSKTLYVEKTQDEPIDLSKMIFPLPTFTLEEKLFINFGYTGFSEEENLKEKLEILISQKAPLDGFCYMWFTDYIRQRFALYFNPEEDPKIEASYTNEEKLWILETKLPDILEKRRELEEKLPLASPIQKEQLINAIKKMEKTLFSYIEVTERTRRLRLATFEELHKLNEEHSTYKSAESQVQKIHEEALKQSEEAKAILKAIEALNEKIIQIATIIVELKNGLERDRQRRENLLEKLKNKSFAERKDMLKNDIMSKKRFITMAARRSRQFPTPILLNSVNLITWNDIAATLNNFITKDPELLKLPRTRVNGRPTVILTPGVGNGIYEWESHSLIIPTIAPEGPLKSVAYALASYRWDADEEGNMRFSYESLKQNKGLSIFNLQKNFCQDYFLWITKEKEGYRILPKEVHNWFKWKFS